MKEHFPIFSTRKELVYLDSAATTHKVRSVIDTMTRFYSQEYGTVHRGLYKEGLEATHRLEKVRENVAHFIGCDAQEVIFTHSATESLNLVAYAYGEQQVNEGDEVLVSIYEHHSNYLPWKLLCDRKKACFIPFTDLEDFKNKISNKTKIVAMTHQSNVIGALTPLKEIIRIAHTFSAVVVADGAQVVGHHKVNMKDLDVDFYAFSGHKMYGPTGVGVLFGKYNLLEKMEPFHGGGGMVERVGSTVTYRKPPHKFEAGTPMIASILGLGSAIDFIQEIGLEKIEKSEHTLSSQLYDQMQGLVTFLDPQCKGSSILSFTINSLHPVDLSTFLSLEGISVRGGNLCAQPLLTHLGVDAVLRISLGIYNDEQDVEKYIKALKALLK